MANDIAPTGLELFELLDYSLLEAEKLSLYAPTSGVNSRRYGKDVVYETNGQTDECRVMLEWSGDNAYIGFADLSNQEFGTAKLPLIPLEFDAKPEIGIDGMDLIEMDSFTALVGLMDRLTHGIVLSGPRRLAEQETVHIWDGTSFLFSMGLLNRIAS